MTFSNWQRGKTFVGESECQPKKTIKELLSFIFGFVLFLDRVNGRGSMQCNAISPPRFSVHCIPVSMNPHCPIFSQKFQICRVLGITTKSDNLLSPSWSVERARDHECDSSSLHYWTTKLHRVRCNIYCSKYLKPPHGPYNPLDIKFQIWFESRTSIATPQFLSAISAIDPFYAARPSCGLVILPNLQSPCPLEWREGSGLLLRRGESGPATDGHNDKLSRSLARQHPLCSISCQRCLTLNSLE